MKHLLICLLALTLAGCSTAQSRTKLPYDSWEIALAAPRYMEVWVESVDVVDLRLLAFEHVHGGVVGYTSQPSGWNIRWGGGSRKPMSGIDLPEIIFVRWQSLVEPQTYNVRIDIPQWVRDEMIKPNQAYCIATKKQEVDFMKIITIAMAPGGIAKAWVGGTCSPIKEIGRFQGQIEKLGPSQGRTDGKYAWPDLEPGSKAYIQKHGIPYGSW
ncbi:DUF2931 family protein [Pseudomonas sp. ZM23]|uniref:DUF2931 family protein n=1 Tax=Pseudomonas triclosanedens TaxID=2961893 RepID=A0ABY6ZUN7_9PSED|nr:DUF2931 family protein [Pseudomonas triclosanedens]MCP8463296.1 DUF2931 family protein [Pseudomonas triclosanedens]MCP8469645.1 DUF2931 family protein [Pseudomonas triclosanedens]MCP8474097.1 DUF2931 family protein [Pseudomonas triclosanedens]WAI48511.1 DUF2931 family protein [Pseudomonas triclosanedens]